MMNSRFEAVTLGEAFPQQQARLRALATEYREIGLADIFAVSMIEDVLQRADAAAISGNVVEMLRLYNVMVNFR